MEKMPNTKGTANTYFVRWQNQFVHLDNTLFNTYFFGESYDSRTK